ncbi:MAG: hypothetical protein QG650_65 [Patescibacteria group bacterium]|nr:hypothetical protein [Patescibacteria group bacterium]
MIRIKKILALVTAICLVIETAFPVAVVFAGSFSGAIAYVSPTAPVKINPGSSFVLKLAGVNTTGTAGPSPYVAFSATQTGYSLVSAGSGFITTGGITTYYPVTGFDSGSSTGTLSASLPTALASYGLSGATIGIPSNYPYKTFDFTATFGATGLGPAFKTGSVSVDVVPHLQSATFSKSAIINNSTDSSVLTVTVLDRNGCSDISTVIADLTSLGGSAIQGLSFQSCDPDAVTATYVSSAITTGVGTGLKTIPITVTDAAGHAQASDSLYASEDLVSSASITVNSPTAPVVTVSSVSPNLIRAGQSASVTWQSSQTGTYRVYAGSGAACGNGSPVETGTVTTANSDIVSTVTSAPLTEGLNPIAVCVQNSEPTE